jgi:hypothetical protein
MGVEVDAKRKRGKFRLRPFTLFALLRSSKQLSTTACTVYSLYYPDRLGPNRLRLISRRYLYPFVSSRDQTTSIGLLSPR